MENLARAAIDEVSWKTRLDRLLPLILLQTTFAAIAFFLVWLIPFNKAPDEVVHYKYSVKFILLHHRLPVAGIDDAEVYRIPITPIKQSGGLVTTQATYAVYPAPSYAIAAVSAWACNRLLGITDFGGARLASAAWGLVFLTLLYFTAWKLSQRRLAAFLITLSFAFIPQVVFIAAYVNVDMFSLALSAAVALSYVTWANEPSASHEWSLAMAISALAIAKYNYFLYGPFLIAAIYRVYHSTKVPLIKLVVKTIICFLVIAAPWYLRNFYYYHDPLGESYLLSTMARFNPPHPGLYSNPLTYLSWAYLLHQGWFQSIFYSFFARFGYMDVSLSPGIYDALKWSVILWASMLCLTVILVERRQEIRLVVLGLGFLVLNVVLSGWNSIRIDYQAQGRYLFPSIMPMACVLALLCRRNSHYIKFVLMLACIVIPLLPLSLTLLVRTYR